MKTLNNTIATRGITLKTIKLSYLLLALLFGMITSQAFAQSSSVQMNHTAFSNLITLGTGASGYLANTLKAADPLIFNKKANIATFGTINKDLEKDLFTVFRTGLPKDNSLMLSKPKCWLECPAMASTMFKKVYVFGYTLEGPSSKLSFKETNLTNNSLLVFRF